MSGSKKIIIAAVIAGIVIAGSAAAFLSTPQTNATVMQSKPNADANAAKNQEIISTLKTASMSNAPALGSPDARVTIVEFGDYQCTWCHRWHESTKDSIISDYVDTGKVRFLFKDFPINDKADRASSLASEASYCAADQGKYWDYHDVLYNNWDGENTGWVTSESLKGFASDIDLDGIQFAQCLDSGKYASLVSQNYNLAASVGLNATPSFIVLVDGQTPKLIQGAQPYATFQKVIDQIYQS